MKVVAKTDGGRVRENNEDYYIVDEEINLFIVADGMGGHQAGEVASELAAVTIQRMMRESLSRPGNHDIEGIIKEAVDRAHNAILENASTNSSLTGMGTTVVMGLFHNERLYVAHVGDSRAYLINSKATIPLTEDHSVVSKLVRDGKISTEEAKRHEMRHVITQCLGCPQYFGPDVRILSYDEGDFLLLCSDGLTDMIEDHAIKEIILNEPMDLGNIPNHLLGLANERGGRDNITVVLIAASTKMD